MTLPLIYALNNASTSDKRKILRIIKKDNDKKDKVQEVIDFVNQSGGIEYAQKVMIKYREEAFDILLSFPESPARNALQQLVIYVTERKK